MPCLVLTPALDGPTNMAIDIALLEAAAQGLGPFLRLYSWTGPWISLGYAQKAQRAIRTGSEIKVARRPTGGKALLHDGDVTYSVALPPGHPLSRVSICDSYKALSERLVAALASLDVRCTLGRLAPVQEVRGSQVPCATEVNIESILVGGRKLVGSAQVRRRGAVLQHGSIPVRASSDRVVRWLRSPSDARPDEEFIPWYRGHATTLEEAGFAFSRDRVRHALIAAFEEL